MKGRAKALLAVLVLAVFASTGCRFEPVLDIVGTWRHWEGFLRAEFTQDGKALYDVDLEGLSRVDRGTYELLSEDRILIDIDSPFGGEFSYEIQGAVLQLVDASGRRQLFNRVKVNKE